MIKRIDIFFIEIVYINKDCLIFKLSYHGFNLIYSFIIGETYSEEP